jgi:hypothetical protein
MGTKSGTVRAMAVAAMLLTAHRPAVADEQPLLAIDVRLLNYANVPDPELSVAKREVARVFGALGVEIWWQNEGSASRSVVLLSKDMAAKKAVTDRVPRNVLGRAAAATGRAYVFYDRVVELAERHRVQSDGLLGTVMAHELGHVLLDVPGHTVDGIMRANLQVRSPSQGFSSAQATRIRRRLAQAGGTGASND